MSDWTHFACLAIAFVATITAFQTARSLVREPGSPSTATVLAVSVCLGFVCTLPSAGTRELAWLPALAGAYFGTIALGTVVCLLCEIRKTLPLSPSRGNRDDNG